MKTSAYHSMINVVNEISRKSKELNIVRQYVNELKLNGRIINFNNKDYFHFGSCGYLGLELDKRLINEAKKAIDSFGIQFVSSRTYVACGLYKELEENLTKIFKGNIIIYPKVSQGHINVMPIIFGPEDFIIMDQQAHVSMQEAIYKLKYYGTEVTILRHNNMIDLEQKIIDNRNKYLNIWYVFDGVYSMFGDSPDYEKLKELQLKYKQLHLYIDDAHGTSWAGENGSGFALSHIELSERIVLVASLVKAYGASGGAFIFKNKEMYEKVVSWGGSYTYAGPIEPATLGAAIASSKIHLSDEIYELQNKLKERIEFCRDLLIKNNLPLISSAHSPIFFVGVGTASMGYNMVKRLMDDGYYTNLGIYPAVPESCTGVRFTLTNHMQFEDIEGLVNTIKKHFPLALKEENRNIKDIVRAFKKFINLEHLIEKDSVSVKNTDLNIHIYKSIHDVPFNEWDSFFSDKGAFSSDFLKTLEKTYSNNKEEENNWNFIYIIIKQNEEIVLATFLTVALTKDDMLSKENVSVKIEEQRNQDKYYMTSKSLIMGSLLSNGEHLYVNQNNPAWKNAFKLFIDTVWKLHDEYNTNMVLFREFNPENTELINKFDELGLAKLEMPENNIIFPKSQNPEEHFALLNKKQRHNLRREVLPETEDYFLKTEKCSKDELLSCYQLYLTTKREKLSVNTFDIPYSFFKNANESENWDIVRVYYKNNSKPLSMGLCYKKGEVYSAIVFGKEAHLRNLYKKSLYLIIRHAIKNNFKILHFGITANETKHIFGATKVKQVGYALLRDNYNAQLLHSMED